MKRATYVRRRFPEHHRPVRACRDAQGRRDWQITNYRGVVFRLSADIFDLAFRKAYAHG